MSPESGPGESVRWKTSRRNWLGPREGWLSLIGLTDEATGRTFARLTREDSLQENLKTLRGYVAALGRPLRVRTDRSTLFGQAAIKPGESKSYKGGQIQRALAELDVEWVPLETPRVMGNSARFFKHAMDRFPKELQAARIQTFEEAASYFEAVFLPEWNRQIVLTGGRDEHRPLLAAQQLESIFSIVEPRQISDDGTVRFHRSRFQIVNLPHARDLAGQEILIETREDGRLLARWNGKCLRLKQIENTGESRAQHSSAPRKARAWNRNWMNGFFDRSSAPIWKMFR